MPYGEARKAGDVVVWQALSVVQHMAEGIPTVGHSLTKHIVGSYRMKRVKAVILKRKVLQKGGETVVEDIAHALFQRFVPRDHEERSLIVGLSRARRPK